MDTTIRKKIINDKQIKKFSAYGFLKNQKFFEPYLLIFLMGNGITLFQIGVLISIKEIIINIFEVPSGIFADYFGKKKELCACFIAYIISFIIFFFSKGFFVAAAAMVFFGLGDAFRSGTHKAMIYTYIETNGWGNYKTFVYGRTRSFSLLGSAVSSILGIFIIIYSQASSYIFLASIFPYLLDFFLILSYPNYLDLPEENKRELPSLPIMLKKIVYNFTANKNLRLLLYSNGIFEAIVKSTKDLIQPILKVLIVGSGIVVIGSLSSENNLNVILGITYFMIYILSSSASRNTWRLRKFKNGYWWLNTLYFGLAVVFILLAVFLDSATMILVLFVFIYLLMNFRKPIYMDVIDNNMKKYERATMLSLSSQLTSLFTIILAPLIGYAADTYGFVSAMIMIAAVMLCTAPFTIIRKKQQ